jgi:hypothetical protein
MSLISPRLEQEIASRPDWYRDEEFISLYQNIMTGGYGTELDTLTEESWQLIGWFANALASGQVMLGNVQPGFNDDDRAGKYAGATPVEVDTIIIHHTATKEDLTVWELEALGLLRLYLPHFMDTNPNGFVKFLLQTNPHLADGSPLAPASGHYVTREGKEVQSFVGYHYIIYPDGTVVNLLDEDHMGFQAGNLNVNNRSDGVAFVGNFSQGAPTIEAQNACKELIKTLRTKNVAISFLDSHTHVKLGQTDCPGPWFEEFRMSEEFDGLQPILI